MTKSTPAAIPTREVLARQAALAERRQQEAIIDRATDLLLVGDCATYDEAVAQAEDEARA